MPDEHASQLSAPELVARLEQSRRSLMDAIAGLDEEGFRLRPREGEWTAAEVLAHILMTEHIFAGRARAVLAQENPPVASISDEERSGHARSAQRMPVPQIVHGLLAQRRDVVGLLKPLSPQQLRRPFRHERRGELAAGWLFQRLAEHEEEHAEQIRSQRVQPTARQA
jgi:hypothetical protein